MTQIIFTKSILTFFRSIQTQSVAMSYHSFRSACNRAPHWIHTDVHFNSDKLLTLLCKWPLVQKSPRRTRGYKAFSFPSILREMYGGTWDDVRLFCQHNSILFCCLIKLNSSTTNKCVPLIPFFLAPSPQYSSLWKKLCGSYARKSSKGMPLDACMHGHY